MQVSLYPTPYMLKAHAHSIGDSIGSISDSDTHAHIMWIYSHIAYIYIRKTSVSMMGTSGPSLAIPTWTSMYVWLGFVISDTDCLFYGSAGVDSGLHPALTTGMISGLASQAVASPGKLGQLCLFLLQVFPPRCSSPNLMGSAVPCLTKKALTAQTPVSCINKSG
jgi:hypothetical protein